MMPEPSHKTEACEMPEDVAEAWAEVYIDVAEKLNANEQNPNATLNDKPQNTLTNGVSPCPNTSHVTPT
ncbi:MAG: hypothetical protein ABL921_11345 [Pirellula sp.]